jgi:AraC family transcriptional regulator
MKEVVKTAEGILSEWSHFEGLPLVFSSEKKIPGSWKAVIRRYQKEAGYPVEETAILNYHYDTNEAKRFLELSFRLSGQTFCTHPELSCESCKLNINAQCVRENDTLDLLVFRFKPLHLNNLIKSEGINADTNAILRFRYNHSFSRTILISGRIRHTIDSILNHRYADAVENIFINAQTQILLLYSLDAVGSIVEAEVPACKFLAHQEERDKIIRSREILLSHIGDPITIRELSRKVAINECYLKKGFKIMFGTTIFDFYQDQRMEHARYLLYEKGLTVSEVAAQLGYSSISHFSTAFKKHTGLKPCELLNRN